MKTEKINFGHLGNGVTVWDSNRIKNNDYMTVAHISYHREIKYYTSDLSEGTIQAIEDLAKNGNMAVSATQKDMYALCPLPPQCPPCPSITKDEECFTINQN
jgi:hypothetical protein